MTKRTINGKAASRYASLGEAYDMSEEMVRAYHQQVVAPLEQAVMWMALPWYRKLWVKVSARFRRKEEGE